MLNWLEDGVLEPYENGLGEVSTPNWNLPEPGGKRVLVVGDVMSRPVRTIAASESLGRASEMMNDFGISHLAVLDRGQFSGLLSDRDVLGAELSDDFVGMHMSTKLLMAGPSEKIPRVASVMVNHHIHCVPILDDTCHLVGLVTTSDILKCMTFQAPLDFWDYSYHNS